MIVYSSPLDGDDDLYLTSVQSNGPHTNLTNNEISDSYRGVSQDGEYIFFSNMSGSPEGNDTGIFDGEIFFTKYDGSAPVFQITDNDNVVVDTLWHVVTNGQIGSSSIHMALKDRVPR